MRRHFRRFRCGGGYALTIRERGRLKEYLVTALSDRFQSDVQIRDITVYVYPWVYVVAHGISLRFHGRTDVPPLMTMETLTLSANLRTWLAETRHVANIHAEGLKITVPPRNLNKPAGPKAPKAKMTLSLVIDEITADDAKLTTLPRDPNKLPHEWDIHHVVLNSVSFDQPAHFHALLTNPTPIGEIDSSGEFGPWNTEEPGDTPLNATFSFSNADLDSLKGLGGILSSKGKYEGALDMLNVEGDTDTPDFSLDVAAIRCLTGLFLAGMEPAFMHGLGRRSRRVRDAARIERSRERASIPAIDLAQENVDGDSA